MMILTFQRWVRFFMVMSVAVLFLVRIADAAFWSRKKEKAEEQREPAQTEAPRTSGAAAVAPGQAVTTQADWDEFRTDMLGIPDIPKVPRTPAAGEVVGLDSINAMQEELSGLAREYEDLRMQQHEQLIELRALGSQAKIHVQVLEDLKSRVPASVSPPGTGINAVDLEKFRLIRNRLNAQRSVLQEITEQQQRLSHAIAAVKTPRSLVPSVPTAPKRPVPVAGGVLREVKSLKETRQTGAT